MRAAPVLVVAVLAVVILAACAGRGRGASMPAAGTTTATGPGMTSSTSTITYGDGPDRVLDLHVPPGDAAVPVVVVVHGGFWYDEYRRDLMDPLVPSLLDRGYAVANIEYRRAGPSGGGWPETFEDVAAAVDALAGRDADAAADGRLDLDRVVITGHSAGGQLAVWAAARHRLPPGAPGADPVVRPIAAVPLAGVLDLARAHDQRLGGGAVENLLGEVTAERMAVTSPTALVPVGVPVTALHGDADRLVPLAQSEAFVAAAEAAGDAAELFVLPGVDHFAWLDARSPAWQAALDAIAGHLG